MAPCNSAQHTRYTTPWGITVTVNKAVERRFREACNKAYNKSKWRRRTGRKGWAPKRIDSYVCRSIRGSSTYSRHAYAAAWDFFSSPPGVVPPGGVWARDSAPPAWFARVFEKYGFTWGGRWTTRPDFPHIEYSSNIVPPL